MKPGDLLSRIQVQNRQRQYRIHRDSVALFCADLLQSLRHPHAALSVVFAGPRVMRVLNRQYRGRDYATDVLSFSYGPIRIGRAPFLGEVILSPEIAVRQALRWRSDPDRELRMLLMHGILHLLGYDHETDSGQMKRLQRTLSRRRFFTDCLPLADLKGNR